MDKVRNGMKEVRIKCDKLESELIKNRDAHIAEHKTAMDGYVGKLIDRLQERIDMDKEALAIIVDGELDDAVLDGGFIRLVRPESHEKDYNRAIKMIQMSADEEMVLDSNEFNRFVMDEWEWKDSFSATNSAYISSKAAV